MVERHDHPPAATREPSHDAKRHRGDEEVHDVAVAAHDLGKRYRIGAARGRDRSLQTEPPNNLGWVSRSLRAGLLAALPFRPKARQDFWALRNVSFEAERGRVMGIIGRNGSGKSTLLKILSRITYPSEGAAVVHGRVGSLLEIGTGFHPELTGRENVFLSGTILGMRRSEVERRFEEIVEFAGVGRFIDTPVKHFSSGMYLRLAFAVASHLRAEVLMIDEVLAVGDAAFQRKCMDRMNQIAADGRTMFFVSHNLSAVARLCRRCLVLEEGRVAALGSVEEGLRAYNELLKARPDQPVSDAGAGLAIHDLRVIHDGEVLRGSDPIELTFEVVVNHRYWLISLFVGISTPEGSHVAIESTGSDQYPELLEPGRYRVRMTVPPLWLRPQGYSAWVKIIAHPQRGKTKRFFSEWIDLVVAGDISCDVNSDRLLAPPATWVISPSASAQCPAAAITPDRREDHGEA